MTRSGLSRHSAAHVSPLSAPQSVPAIALGFDAKGRITQVDDAWQSQLGYCRETTLGQPLCAFLTPPGRKLFEAWRGSAQTCAALRLELLHPLRCATQVLLTLTRPAPGRAGTALIVLAAGAEPEENTAAPECCTPLRRSQDLLETAGMLTGLGYWEFDPKSDKIFWSDETCRIHGVAPGFAPSFDDVLSFYPPEAQDKILAAVSAALTDGTSWDEEQPMTRADGTRGWVRCAGVATLENGQPVRLNGAFQDITARKEAEFCLAEAAAEAQTARDRLTTLSDNMPGAIFERAITADGQIYPRYFSARLPELLGVPRAEILANPSAAFRNLAPEDRAATRATIEMANQTLLPVKMHYRLNHPKKGLRWIEAASHPHIRTGAETTWFGYLHDVTEERLEQQKLTDTLKQLNIANDRLNRLTQSLPVGIFEFQRKPDGTAHYPYLTSRFADLFELSVEDLQRDSMLAFSAIPLHDIEHIQEAFRVSEEKLSVINLRHRLILPSGKNRWLHVMASPVRQPDGSTTWFGKTTDITESVMTEKRALKAGEAARKAHDKISTMLDIAPVGLFELCRHPDGWVDFPFVSTRCCDLFGFSPQNLARSAATVMKRVHQSDTAEVLELINESARTQTAFRARFRYAHPQLGLIWLTASAQPRKTADGRVVWVGAVYDVTSDVLREAELKRAYSMAEEMRVLNEHLALHDELTGLPNRRHYEREIEARIRAAKRQEGPRDCTMIQIDVDHFKHVNDTQGHEAGDQVLRYVADALRNVLRATDFAARLGGDEFSVVLAPGSTMQDARTIVELLRSSLNRPLHHFGRSTRITASFGIVQASDVTDLHEELQAYTDAALYRAKEAGRNRVEVFSGDLSRHLHDTRWLAGALRQAIDEGQLEPWFQPQISAQTGALVGVEALVRWRHPTRGILGPDLFMKVAEQMRLVPEIDRIVMEKTHLLLNTWRQEGFVVPKVSFNVSAARVREANLIAAASQLVQNGTRVALELVETIRVEEEDGVFQAHLALLRAAGIDIEIDDFGSGHTSIIGLMEARPSALKIDRRLVMGMPGNARATDMVRTIVQMASALGIATIAEGVETDEQAVALQAMHCDVLQGYLFARPLDPAGLRDFARQYGFETGTDQPG